MNDPLRDQRETTEDLSAGQGVILSARWILIVTALIITLWSPLDQDTDKIKVSLVVLLGLAVGNFFLHAQVLMRRPVTASIVYGATAVDIAVITLITWTFGWHVSSIFVFYYPALLALALVFPLSVTFYFTAAIVATYAGVAFVSTPGGIGSDGLQILVVRLISMIAVAVIGYMYQNIECERRASAEAGTQLAGAGVRPS